MARLSLWSTRVSCGWGRGGGFGGCPAPCLHGGGKARGPIFDIFAWISQKKQTPGMMSYCFRFWCNFSSILGWFSEGFGIAKWSIRLKINTLLNFQIFRIFVIRGVAANIFFCTSNFERPWDLFFFVRTSKLNFFLYFEFRMAVRFIFFVPTSNLNFLHFERMAMIVNFVLY